MSLILYFHFLSQINLAKVGSIYWGEFAQGPIQILPIWDTTWTLFPQCATGYGIWDNFNFPILIPHRHLCKYGPHLGIPSWIVNPLGKCRMNIHYWIFFFGLSPPRHQNVLYANDFATLNKIFQTTLIQHVQNWEKIYIYIGLFWKYLHMILMASSVKLIQRQSNVERCIVGFHWLLEITSLLVIRWSLWPGLSLPCWNLVTWNGKVPCIEISSKQAGSGLSPMRVPRHYQVNVVVSKVLILTHDILKICLSDVM